MAGPQRAERLRVLSCGRRPHYFSTRLLGQVIVLTPAWPSHAQVVVRLLACALTIGGRAAAKFPGGLPPEDRFARQRLLLERVSPDSDAFSEEDAAFLEHREDLEALVSKYAG